MFASTLLSPGEEAPAFTFKNADGREMHTSELRGRPCVIYFYPKDDTPGCTKEACGFRDNHAEFERRGAPVIGVSPDSHSSHDKFRQKHQLPFGLAADTDNAVAKAYGAWGLKKFSGREYEGVLRVTFLIDSHGRVAKVYPKVSPEEHAREILRDLDSLPHSS